MINLLVVAMLLGQITAAPGENPGTGCERATVKFDLQGPFGNYVRSVSNQWLKVAPASNPGMLEMFRDRDRLPHRPLEPWAGEFAGKYLTGAVEVLRLTGDRDLRDEIARFVAEWISLQDDDGYLGPWPRGHRLTGMAPNVGSRGVDGPTWDAWGHDHALVGLLLWYEESGDEKTLRAARRIGDLLCDRFLGAKKPRLVETGSDATNLAPVHGLCLLYKKTNDPRHLAMAKQIVQEFAAKGPQGQALAGDYVRAGLAGTEFFATNRPRWESLHPILGLAELYHLTGDATFRQAFEHHWWSIVKGDRHNNGGFSTDEQARGNPYLPGAIETCCTVAWMAMSVEMLRITENSLVADELELSTWNSGLGMHSPSGRWSTYNTPMDGVRKASTQDIVFQAREGTPELNCCSVNAARVFGLMSDWALMRDQAGLILNAYGPGTMTTQTPSGVAVTLRQFTDYPRDGKIRIVVEPAHEVAFTLKLRIPHWSARTMVSVNGEQQNTESGSYLKLSRSWNPGDRVEMDLDFSPHFWVGEQECAGKVSAYRGPLLLTWDRRFNEMDPADVPEIEAHAMPGRVVAWSGTLKPVLLLEMASSGGKTVRLCDFASAGQAGSPYRSWLRIAGVTPTKFDAINPLRSGRPRP